MNELNKINFGDIEGLINSICTLVTPLKEYKIPEGIKFIKTLGAFFGFGDSSSSVLIKDMEEMKTALKNVEKSLVEIRNELQLFEKQMEIYLNALSQDMQKIYSLIEFTSATKEISVLFTGLNTTTNLWYEDMQKLEIDTKNSSSLYDKAKEFFSRIYNVADGKNNDQYMRDIRGLVLNIKSNQGILPKEEIGVAYYRYIKTLAAGQNKSSLYVRSLYCGFELKIIHSVATMVYLSCAAIKFQLYDPDMRNKPINRIKMDLKNMYTALIDCMEAVGNQRKQNFESDLPSDFKDKKCVDDYIFSYSLGKSMEWTVNSTAVHRKDYAKKLLMYNRDILYLKPGKSQKLFCFHNQYNYCNAQWKSNDENVALVDSYGRIFAVNPGMTEIQVDIKGVEQPYPVTAVVESNTNEETIFLKPKGDDSVFRYKAGETYKISELLPTQEWELCDDWKSENPEFIKIENRMMISEKLTANVMCMVSGHAMKKDKEKILCYAVIDLEAYSYSDEVHLYCLEDFEYFLSGVKCKKLFLEKDLDLSDVYYSTYFTTNVDFEIDGKGHSLNLGNHVFTSDIQKNGYVKNLVLKGNNINREYGVTGRNLGTISRVQNHMDIVAESGHGGICRKNEGIIEFCDNFGSIRTIYTDLAVGVGGICCANQGEISHCTNHGDIVNGGIIGGICAFNSGAITDSANKGNLNTGNTAFFTTIAVICVFVGGKLANCSGSGKVSYPTKRTSQHVGGILSLLHTFPYEGCSCDAVGPDSNVIDLLVDLKN